ncbi:hypothetical protein V8D89_014198 [Ganoderma adspersum]
MSCTCNMLMITSYEILLGSQPTRPEAYQASVPRHPSQGRDTDITDMAISGDILSCIVRDTSQLGAFFDNPNAQLKPLVPPVGLEQVHLIHRPTNTARWLHPGHVSSLNSVHVLFNGNYLYLLGRTPTTYILRRYHFSTNMLIGCPDNTFLDLGEPLDECESPPLPDPGIPWGSWDSQNVHLEPSSHLSVLMLRSWYGEGQYLRFPLRSWGQPSVPMPTPTVVRLEPDTHLPSNAHLSPRWLGRDQAMMFSDDDDDQDKNLLVRLSFSHPDSEDVSPDRSPSADVRAAGRVLREDVLTKESPLARETNILTRAHALSVDEESGRICALLMNGEGLVLSSA